MSAARPGSCTLEVAVEAVEETVQARAELMDLGAATAAVAARAGVASGVVAMAAGAERNTQR